MKAETSAGDVIMSSDGVIVIPDGAVLEGVEIKDGHPCSDMGMCFFIVDRTFSFVRVTLKSIYDINIIILLCI